MYVAIRVALLLMTVALSGVGGIGPAQAGRAHDVRPIIEKRSFPDPSVERFRDGLIAVSTGPLAPRAWQERAGAPWRDIGPALLQRPAWSTTGQIWAADIIEGEDQWLLYYSITVRGLRHQGRCIGVATAPTPLEPFVNVGRKPLVCPRKAKAPRAYDLASREFPRRGVIDPSAFTDPMGRRHLLYKTQGRPSTIRMVLGGSGVVTVDDGSGPREIEVRGDPGSFVVLQSDAVGSGELLVTLGAGVDAYSFTFG